MRGISKHKDLKEDQNFVQCLRCFNFSDDWDRKEFGNRTRPNQFRPDFTPI